MKKSIHEIVRRTRGRGTFDMGGNPKVMQHDAANDAVFKARRGR